jgi:hypothetical protein
MPHNVHGQQRVRLAVAARRAWVSGASASVASAIAVSICSRIDEGSYAGGLNGPSQWLWGEAEAYAREASVRHTVVGYVVHHLMSVFWATAYERIFGESVEPKKPLRRCAEAAVCTAGAYIVDYYLTPPRLRPGFKKHVRTPYMFVVYGGFALGLAAASIVRDRQSTRRAPGNRPAYSRV